MKRRGVELTYRERVASPVAEGVKVQMEAESSSRESVISKRESQFKPHYIQNKF